MSSTATSNLVCIIPLNDEYEVLRTIILELTGLPFSIKDFNDFIDKKLIERLGSAYATDIEKFSDQEVNELYFLTFIVISESVLEYVPKIKDFKSQIISIKAKKADNIWTLENSVYDYTEF